MDDRKKAMPVIQIEKCLFGFIILMPLFY